MSTGKEALDLSLRAHKGWCTQVAWCPSSPHLLISGAHDSLVKVWDIRSSLPLHSINMHSDKVLALCWQRLQSGNVVDDPDDSSQATNIISAGADRMLRAFSVKVQRR